jgi:phage terminase large subunit GpA-like protein
MAETWEIRRQTHTWEKLGERLAGDHQRGVVPDDCGLLTVGIDVQQDYFVWCLAGWAPDDREYLIDYGESMAWSDLRRDVLAKHWPGVSLAALPIAMGGIDSGHRTDEVYGFCQEIGDALRPTKGFESLERPIIASSLEWSRDALRRALAASKGMHLWKFNKPYWHEELQRRLDSLRAKEAGSLTIPADSRMDADLLGQLLNNVPVEQPSGKFVWQKVRQAEPDDYRDALVIARVVKEMWTRGNESRIQLAAAARLRATNREPVERPSEPRAAGRFLNRPGGWIGGMQ